MNHSTQIPIHYLYHHITSFLSAKYEDMLKTAWTVKQHSYTLVPKLLWSALQGLASIVVSW